MNGSERAATAASGFAAALALATSIYNVYLQRAQVRAQVWPHLEYSYSNVPDEKAFTLNVENAGVGPAIVRYVRLEVDGKELESWNDAFAAAALGKPALAGFLERPSNYTQSPIGHRVIGPGATIHPLRIGGVADEEQAAMGEAFVRLSAEICYCSTLDECWLLRRGEPAPIARCPAH